MRDVPCPFGMGMEVEICLHRMDAVNAVSHGSTMKHAFVVRDDQPDEWLAVGIDQFRETSSDLVDGLRGGWYVHA